MGGGGAITWYIRIGTAVLLGRTAALRRTVLRCVRRVSVATLTLSVVTAAVTDDRRPLPRSETQTIPAAVATPASTSAISAFTAPSPLGADNRPALRDWLGMSDDEIEQLEQQRALV